MKKLFILVLMFFLGSTWVVAQVTPCNCSATVSGTQNFSALTWTYSSGAPCPTAISTSYIGNLCISIPNNANLVMDKNFTIGGGLGISSTAANCTFTLPAGITLNISGNMGDDDNNNTKFVINGNLNVGGTIYGKNGNNFSGNGNVTAGGLNFKGEPTCSPCNIDWNVPPGQCVPAGAFCDIVLPVTLLFFKATPYPQYVQLSWATASELNFDRFVIEKTRDGSVYEEIGERQGAGISNTRIDYSFKDEQVMLGRTYYRLKAIDFDGYTEYFGLVSAFYEGAQDVSIFPNPAASGNVNIYFNYFSEEPVFCKVMDVSGSEVYTGTIQRTGFDSNYKIENTFASGMYFLEVRTGLSKKVIRFVVN